MAKPRRRQADQCFIFKLWDSIAPYWQLGIGICTVFITTVLWVGQVSSHEGRISDLEADKTRLRIVEQRVEDIATYMGVPKRDGKDIFRP